MNPTARLPRFRLRRLDFQMDPALRTLLKLRLRGFVRYTFRGLKTVRGAAFTLVGVAMLVLWLGPNLMAAGSMRRFVEPESVRAIIPLALLGFCLLSVVQVGGKAGIHFSGAEIDFLFGGPFTRRELLLYKLVPGVASAGLVALLFSTMLLAYVHWWVAAFVGIWLAILFVQLFSTAAVLLGQTVAEHAYTRVRRVGLLALFVLLGLGAWWVASNLGEGGLLPAVRHVHDSWPGKLLLAPLDVFGRAITAQTLVPELIGWGTLALAVNLALLTLVLRLDVNYTESAIALSQKRYRRLQQMRRGGGTVWAGKTTARIRLPMLPWLGGAGPIIRKQLIHAARSGPGTLVLLIVVSAPLCVMAFVMRRGPSGAPFAFLSGVLIFTTVAFGRMIPFDFRGDLDRMDWLKSLPLRSTAIAAGQILVPTLVMTCFHCLLLLGAAVFMEGPRTVLAVIAVYAVPFNFLVFSLENLLFLLFPSRVMPATPGDLQHMGRTIVEMMVKMLLLFACGGSAAALGGIAYLICGQSWIAAVAVSWSVLAVECAAMVPCVAAAFRKFDVSVDTPP